MEKHQMPSYIPYDDTKINRLLKRANISNPKEIELFHSLAKVNQEKITYKDALTHTDLASNESVFLSNLQKLQASQLVILRHSLGPNGLDNEYIRLCDEDSLSFYAEYISEMCLISHASRKEQLPFHSELVKNGILISEQYIQDFNADELQQLYGNSPETNENILTIFKIPTLNDTFYFTASTVPYICELMINYMKTILSKGNMSHVLARHLDVTLSEIREKIDTTDFIVWKELVDTLYFKLESLKDNQNFIEYPELLHCAIILHFILEPKINQLQSNYEFKETLNDFSKKVITKMQNFNNALLEHQFLNLLNETLDSMQIKQDIKKYIEKFQEDFVIPMEILNDDAQPSIIKIDQYYVHIMVLMRIISDHYFIIVEDLKRYYLSLFKKYLRNQLLPKDMVFLQHDTFETSVHQKVRQLDELYYKILKKPVGLASVIIYFNKNTGPTVDSSDNAEEDQEESQSTKKLNIFFDLQTKELLKWATIFNLNIAKLGTEAYRSLGIFTKIVLIFTGRYKNLHTRLRRITAAHSQSGDKHSPDKKDNTENPPATSFKSSS